LYIIIEKNLEENMPSSIIKDDAHKLIDKMPDNSTWDDLIYEIYVRQVIEKGLSDSKSGKVKDVSELRNKYGLT
jgi:transcriptional/translational regulatory protein YebC/TACO1